ncbi:MAG: hypothetical protein H6999_10835 [Hahellaceae bacterium]|nr:hypothetical protein [Hahellaceae bacterium]
MNIKRKQLAAFITAFCGFSGVSLADNDAAVDVQPQPLPYNYLGGFSVGYKYQEMEADTIRDAYVKTVGLNIAQVEWIPEKASWMQSYGWLRAIRPKIHYEFTPAGSAAQDEIVRVSDSEKEAWQRLVADLDITPASWFTGTESEHHLVANYDLQTFLVTVQATRDYWFVEQGNAKLLVPGDKLDASTTFKELTVGYQWQKPDEIGYVGMGYFNVNYEKPVSTDVLTPLETIYTGEFDASGLYLLLGVVLDKAWDIYARYDTSTDAEANIQGNTSLATSGFSFTPTIEYEAIKAGLRFDMGRYWSKAPFVTELAYIQRKFDVFVGGEELNDDRIISFSISGQFSL